MDQRDESAAKAWLELVLYERGQRVSAERRLQSEEVGRAVAEAKIDGLESALRRVNQLVDDLTTAIRRQAVDPDLDLDRPAN
jgi:hypothetical protein